MPRRTPATTGSPEVTTTIRMPSNSPAAETESSDKPFFWERLAQIPAEKWEHDVEIWIYRLEPKVRMATGERGYLDIVTQPITPVYIKKRWGGGRFRIMVLENNKILYSTEEEIEGDPIYDKKREVPADGTSAPASSAASDGNVLKVLELQNERLYQVLTTLQDAKGENPAISSAVDILTTAYKTGLNAVATQPNANADSTKNLTEIIALAERIISVRGDGNGGGNSLTDAIKTLTDLGVLNKPKSLKDQLEELKAMGELIGGGGGEGAIKNPWLIGLKMLEPHLPEILESLKTSSANTIAAAQARAAEARSRAQAAENLRRVQPGARPAPAAQPQAAPASAAPPAPAIRVDGGLQIVARDGNNVGAPTPPTVIVERAAPEVAETPETQEQFDTNMKIQMVNMLRMGCSGDAIAHFVEDVKEEFAKDFAKYSAQQITDFFLADPILRLMVEDPEFTAIGGNSQKRWEDTLAEAKEYMAETVLVN